MEFIRTTCRLLKPKVLCLNVVVVPCKKIMISVQADCKIVEINIHFRVQLGERYCWDNSWQGLLSLSIAYLYVCVRAQNMYVHMYTINQHIRLSIHTKTGCKILNMSRKLLSWTVVHVVRTKCNITVLMHIEASISVLCGGRRENEVKVTILFGPISLPIL